MFCADINDQSHLTAASRGFAQRYFCMTEALTVPQVNGLQIVIEIHRYFLFGNFPTSNSYLSCYSCGFYGVLVMLRCLSIITYVFMSKFHDCG